MEENRVGAVKAKHLRICKRLRQATVYIAFGTHANTLPGWLQQTADALAEAVSEGG